MPEHELLTHTRRVAKRPRGFILLAVLVFLLLASLLSLGDLRTVITQQRMVTTQLGAGNEFAYTESALNVLESFAVEELASIAAGNTYKGAGPTALNDTTCSAVTISDPLTCTLASCSSYNNINYILNNVNGQTPKCSFCRPPSPGCMNRLDEPKTDLPWTDLPIVFNYTDSAGTVINNNYIGVFSTYMEYLGMAPCDFSVNNANVTSLGVCGSTVCPGFLLVDGTPTCSTSVPSTYVCPVMRVTVSNHPATPLAPSITLQSTVIGAYGSLPAKRISFRQVLP